MAESSFDAPAGRRAGPLAGALPGRLRWISVLPAGGAVLLAVPVTLFVAGSDASEGARLVVAAAGCVAFLLLVTVIWRETGVLARQSTDDIHRAVGELAALVTGQATVVTRLTAAAARGEQPVAPRLPAAPLPGAGPLAELHTSVMHLVGAAYDAAAAGASRSHVEVFVLLARRLQSLVTRAIAGMDALEHEIEDPELLSLVFEVDHLITRVRREAENIGVLGGATPRRITAPVAAGDVLRLAVSEVEHYRRVKVSAPAGITLQGPAVADTVHLLAELIDNAAAFSPPETQVLVSAEMVTAGLAIEIDDRGLLIPPERRREFNELLARPDKMDLQQRLRRDGQIGLIVVARLARQHGIAVELQPPTVYGGNRAAVVLPNSLLHTAGTTNAPAPERDLRPRKRATTETEPAAAHQAPIPLTGTAAGRGADRRAADGNSDGLTTPGGVPPQPLPKRSRVRTAGAAVAHATGDGTEADGQRPPPLPRREGSHLAPALRRPATAGPGDQGPQTGLMAHFLGGVRRAGEAGRPPKTPPPDRPASPSEESAS